MWMLPGPVSVSLYHVRKVFYTEPGGLFFGRCSSLLLPVFHKRYDESDRSTVTCGWLDIVWHWRAWRNLFLVDINMIFFFQQLSLLFFLKLQSTAALAVINAELTYQDSKLLPSNTCKSPGESKHLVKYIKYMQKGPKFICFFISQFYSTTLIWVLFRINLVTVSQHSKVSLASQSDVYI